MDTAREERAKLQLYHRFCDVLAETRDKDAETLRDREYAICSVSWYSTLKFAFLFQSKICESGNTIASLARSGNQFMDKIVYIFGTLVVEVDLLTHEGREKYIDQLLLYGEDRKSRVWNIYDKNNIFFSQRNPRNRWWLCENDSRLLRYPSRFDTVYYSML